MVYPLLTGSTLLRTQRTSLPRTFCRYGSITAAIERGRNDRPERPFKPRTRSFNDDGNSDGVVKTRRESRFEKFGPARDDAGIAPPRDREERPRSSRFGRVPRDNDAPSRFSDREEPPPRHWEGRGRIRPDGGAEKRETWREKSAMKPKSEWALAGHERLDFSGTPLKDRVREGRGELEEWAPRPERFGGGREERSFEGGRSFDKPRTPFGDRPARDFGRDDRGGRREFNRDDRGGERKPFNRDDRGGERRQFNRDDRGGERKSFGRDDGEGERKPFNRDDRGAERKPFNRDDRGGERRTFSRDDRGSDRRDFNKDDRGYGSRVMGKDFTSERPERFSRPDSASPSTFRTRDTTEDRPRESRFTHRPDSKGARREGERNGREDTDAPTSDATAQKPFVRGPESLPYSTAASEFIYGHSSVLAAIKANRRRFYNLYVHSRGAGRDGLMSKIRAHKLFSITQEVGDEYMRALDKASSGRPHNGVILESSPLPVPPITELKTANIQDESFSVGLDSQSAEDLLVNGKQELYSYKSGGWRHPLILYVDGVVDEGNLGAIARSAYVLGADAIITPTHHTATWSHIALKASAGAAEAIPLFRIGEPTEFLGKSSRAGWRIYASDAVPPAPASLTSPPSSEEGEKEGEAAVGAAAGTTKVVYTIARSPKRLPAEHSPVAEHPTILMMGAEGTGLKTSLLNLAHYKVGIPHGREVNEVGVDSLNVSVAASILCYEMLQKPQAAPKKDPEDIMF